MQAKIKDLLAERGAIFFEDMATTIGGFRNDILDALWDLVWTGEVTNDTLAPLRSLRREKNKGDRRRRRSRRAFRSRRVMKTPGSEGRWSLLVLPDRETPVVTRELIYTGITRAKQNVEVWASESGFIQGVRERTVRTSGLRDALWKA